MGLNKLFLVYLLGLSSLCLLGVTASGDDFADLQTEVQQLKSEVQELKTTVKEIQTKMTFNIADQYADKTISYIKTNNQKDASKFWMELLNHAKDKQTSADRSDELLSKIVTQSYSNKRSNFYPLLEFILKNNITQAFPHLYSELESQEHLFDGHEVFVLAHYLKQSCGESTTLYRKIPEVVKQIISGPVIFKNQDNKGYVIATQHQPCKDRQECYGNPKTEAFIHKLTHSLKQQDVLKNPRSHWKFMIPTTMDMTKGFNGTRMAWGFHIKNVAEDKFLIVKMRLTSYFLRDDTKFDPYFAGDLQCQFMPMLVKGKDGIKMGIRDKYIHKMEFVYGGKWEKKGDKVQLGRRALHDLEGMVWEVIPVLEEGEMNTNSLEDEMVNSKCQF